MGTRVYLFICDRGSHNVGKGKKIPTTNRARKGAFFIARQFVGYFFGVRISRNYDICKISSHPWNFSKNYDLEKESWSVYIFLSFPDLGWKKFYLRESIIDIVLALKWFIVSIETNRYFSRSRQIDIFGSCDELIFLEIKTNRDFLKSIRKWVLYEIETNRNVLK